VTNATSAAATAAASTPPNIVASPVAIAAAPDQSEKQDYGPQSKWNRRLSPMTAYQVSVANQYVKETGEFTEFQREHFWNAVLQARRFHGGEDSNSEQHTATIVKNWNEKHYELISNGQSSIGLGGLIRANHVKNILRKKGNEIIASQAGGTNPHQRWRRTLKRDGIDGLSYSDAAAWLKVIGKPVGNTLPKRKAELVKHFNGKPADYEIIP
jgi:hypothetical protein